MRPTRRSSWIGGDVVRSFGERLRQQRERAGLTQEELARRAEVSVRAVRDIERGVVARPRQTTAARLAEAAGLPEPVAPAAGETAATSAGSGRPGGPGVAVLGPLVIRQAGGATPVRSAMQRNLLGLLALHTPQVVSSAEIVDVLWDSRPPQSSANLVHVYVGRLRGLLEPGRPARGAGGGIVAVGGGYRLDLDRDRLDAARFEELADRAQRAGAGGQAELALDLGEQALRCWRGRVVADAGPRVRSHPAAVQVEQRRLNVAVDVADTAIRLGRHREAATTLQRLVADEPLHEGLHARLMLALAGSGRQADALQLYFGLRTRLAEELGIEPGPELATAYLRVIHGDTGGGTAAGPSQPAAVTIQPGAAPAPTTRRAHRRPPAQLPPDVAGFTGRQQQLALLDGIAGGPADHPTAVVVSTVSGTAGVGKTALAVHWAHRVRERFPDGQLYVNLRGYDPDLPMTAGDALAGFLSALGVTGQDLPLTEAERSARFRTEVAGSRVLIVLDNASSVEQVRPLLPGSASCTVLVTSRDSLAGLVVRDGARRVNLDLLPVDEAVALLRRLIGERVDAEPGAAVALAEQCARLPLALRVAAELAATRDTTPLADLVAELDDRQRRLDLLDVGHDPHAAVRAVFSWSVRSLPPDAAHAFALLGLHPGPDVDASGLAALTGADVGRAGQILDVLARAHLIQHARRAPDGAVHADRYGMHDLMRAYAVQLATGDDDTPAATGEAVAGDGPMAAGALERLFAYYLAAAAAAMDTLHPAESHYRPRIRSAGAPVPGLSRPDAARAWLDTERPVLVAATAHAARHGHPADAVHLSTTLHRYLDGGHHADALAVHGHARDAACRSGDPAGEAQACFGLGCAYLRLGHGEPATEHLAAAVALFRRVGDRTGQARALATLGHVDHMRGRYDLAVEHYEQARVLAQAAGDRNAEARALSNLGFVESILGRRDQAVEHFRWSLALCQELGDRNGEAYILNNLGNVEQQLGRVQAATGHQERALTLFRELGDRAGEAWTLDSLGTLLAGSGRPGQAADRHRQALALFDETGEKEGQLYSLNGLGEAAHVAGDHELAVTHHTAALAMATELGLRDQQARALTGIADADQARGDVGSARNHLEHALGIHSELGTPEAAQLRARLAALAETSRPRV
jgi:DNA-binding SARP family transcriptional activator/tetratricopeptide (TPR) repeat protein/DNA-binding XRE family transcriptional regulator